MFGLTKDAFQQPPQGTPPKDPRTLYMKSYMLIRTSVGLIGLVLPVFLAIGDYLFVDAGIEPKGLPTTPPQTSFLHLIGLRGSISAYYHTPVGDWFVGGLVVVGFLLLTYMAGLRRTWDFVLSLVAGAALL